MPPKTSRPFLPLKGVRVLSFEVAYSLPAGTRTLAELGAEVVRVAGPGRESFYISVVDGVFLSKPCVGINLKDPDGLATARQLAAQADVVCSNFVPGVMERLGLGPDELRKLNPTAIVLQLSGYGSPGPWSGYAAFGPSTEAAGGMNALVGPESGPPVRLGSGVFSDQLGGRFAALALIAALEERQRTGEGKYIDLSMAEAISLLVGHTVAAAGLGDTPPRLGNRDRDFAPQGVYPAKGDDEWVAITVRSDSEWKLLLAAMEEDTEADPGLAEGLARLRRPEFATAAARHANHDAIDAILSSWTADRDKFELEARLQAFRIPCAAVVRNRDPLFDPHLRARGLFQHVEHDRPILGFAAHPHPTTPWFATDHARHQLRDIRFPGADNVGILRDWLGMDESQVRALEASGALISNPTPTVEDRRTNYRDADWAEQLGLEPAEIGGAHAIKRENAALTTEARTLITTTPLSRSVGRGARGEGLRILEVSNGPAAAFAGMLLAELGHEVTSVDDPMSVRRLPTAPLSEAERAFLQRGKKRRDDTPPTNWRSTMLELGATMDAVIDDLGPGGLGGMGLTAHALRDQNRDIIVASISPFGQTGPKSRWAASELTIQASAGVLHSTGWTNEPPAKAGGFPAHYIAGLNAATAVLARAYGVRAGTCNGGRIDVSMQETYIPHWSRHIGEWTYTGTRMRRERPGFGHQGFRHTAMAADGWVYVLSLYATWEEIALFFGLTDFLGSEWSNAEYRMEHWREIEGPYLETVRSKSRYEWFRLGAEAGYTFAPVHFPADQFANPQFAARGFLKDATLAGTTVKVPGLPFPWVPKEPRA